MKYSVSKHAGPGESVRVESSFAGPKAFMGLRVGPDHRLWELGPGGKFAQVTTASIWRVDEVRIDDVAAEHVVAALEAEALCREDRGVLMVNGHFGVGSRVVIRATNVGSAPSYFYATWELEDVVTDLINGARDLAARIQCRL